MVKNFVLRYYLPIALTACLLVIIVALIVRDDVDWRLSVTIVGGILSSIYFVQKQRLEELRLFEELFTEFNARYDELNESMNRILRGDSEAKLEPDELDILYNYFNLSGEEYFYYKQGYIYPEVWKAWRNGMKIFYQSQRIKEEWEKELANDSYYGFKLSELEK